MYKRKFDKENIAIFYLEEYSTWFVINQYSLMYNLDIEDIKKMFDLKDYELEEGFYVKGEKFNTKYLVDDGGLLQKVKEILDYEKNIDTEFKDFDLRYKYHTKFPGQHYNEVYNLIPLYDLESNTLRFLNSDYIPFKKPVKYSSSLQDNYIVKIEDNKNRVLMLLPLSKRFEPPKVLLDILSSKINDYTVLWGGVKDVL